MSSSHYIAIALSSILLLFLIFTLLKGIIRTLVMVAGICLAIGLWLFIQSNGFTLLSFVTSSPQPWMVQACAYGLALAVLMVFYHAVTWFSSLFSPRKFSKGGVLTTLLMLLLMLWLGAIGISYYANIARVSYYHDLALATQRAEAPPELPLFCRIKDTMSRSPLTQWLEHIDPMDSPSRTRLACLVAYGCSLSEEEYTRFFEERLRHCGIPQATRFLDLFGDPGLRTFVQEGHFVSLLENERLNTFLGFMDTEEKLPRFY